MPWVLAKDEANKARLATVMYNLVEALRFANTLLQAFLPTTATKISAQLGFAEDDLKFENLKFGYKTDVTVKKGDVIFPRIDIAKEMKLLEEQEKAKAEAAAKAAAPAVEEEKPEPKAEITIDDFIKIDLVVGEIRHCERLPKSDKLLKSTIFDGERERTILSGIAQWYTPEDMIGKKVVIVANLAPRKMRGVISEGMILASEADGDVKVVFIDKDVPAGSRIG